MKKPFERQITAVIKEPGQRPRVEYLFDNSLESFKKTVGGRIETVTVFPDIRQGPQTERSETKCPRE